MKRILSGLIAFIFSCMMAFSAELSAGRQNFIDQAKAYLGTPYKYGGTSKSGIDCSGLVYIAAKNAGMKDMPRTVATIYKFATQISSDVLEPGDLVFFGTGGTPSHIGIYLGSSKFIHSASEGSKTGVIISKMSESYWKKHFHSYGRVLKASSAFASASPSTSTTAKTGSKTTTSTQKTTTTTKKTSTTKANSAISLGFLKYSQTALMVDWSCYDSQEAKLLFRGATAMVGVQPSSWFIKPGILVKATYQYPDFLQVPVCFVLGIDNYFQIYAGINLATAIVCTTTPGISSEELQTPIFPGHFGFSLKTPSIKMGSSKYSLIQDFSYTHYESFDEPLSLKKYLSNGVTLSTGICVTR